MMDPKLAAQTIEASAREALAGAYRYYPGGCDNDQMKAFLKAHCKYPQIAYAMARGWEFKTLIDKEVEKFQ